MHRKPSLVYRNAFKERLSRAAAAAGLSRSALAGVLNTRYVTVYRWLRGDCVPETEVLSRLSPALGVSVAWLLGMDDSSCSVPASGSGNVQSRTSMWIFARTTFRVVAKTAGRSLDWLNARIVGDIACTAADRELIRSACEAATGDPVKLSELFDAEEAS